MAPGPTLAGSGALRSNVTAVRVGKAPFYLRAGAEAAAQRRLDSAGSQPRCERRAFHPGGRFTPSYGSLNLQVSSETLRVVEFTWRSLMSYQRQGATRTVEERLQKRKAQAGGGRGLSFFNRWFVPGRDV
jgi:hypothetical protein